LRRSLTLYNWRTLYWLSYNTSSCNGDVGITDCTKWKSATNFLCHNVHTKFHRNTSSGSDVETCGRTDMTGAICIHFVWIVRNAKLTQQSRYLLPLRVLRRRPLFYVMLVSKQAFHVACFMLVSCMASKHVPPKRRLNFGWLEGVISHKTSSSLIPLREPPILRSCFTSLSSELRRSVAWYVVTSISAHQTTRCHNRECHSVSPHHCGCLHICYGDSWRINGTENSIRQNLLLLSPLCVNVRPVRDTTGLQKLNHVCLMWRQSNEQHQNIQMLCRNRPYTIFVK
jgi:hypothetical protein